MNYPVTAQVATDGRRNVTAAVPVRDPNVNLIVNRADLIFDRAGRTSARVLPAGFPREIRARRAAPAVATAEPVDATAATGSVTASPRAVASNLHLLLLLFLLLLLLLCLLLLLLEL